MVDQPHEIMRTVNSFKHVNIFKQMFCLNMVKRIPRDWGPKRMRLCAPAESSTERSAASDITLVLLSRSPILTTQITSVFPAANSHTMNMIRQFKYIYIDPSFKRV